MNDEIYRKHEGLKRLLQSERHFVHFTDALLTAMDPGDHTCLKALTAEERTALLQLLGVLEVLLDSLRKKSLQQISEYDAKLSELSRSKKEIELSINAAKYDDFLKEHDLMSTRAELTIEEKAAKYALLVNRF